MASEIRLNADGACLTLDEMQDFTKQARKYGVPGDTPIGVKIAGDVAVFSVPVTLVHRTLTESPQNGRTDPAMRGARRQRR